MPFIVVAILAWVLPIGFYCLLIYLAAVTVFWAIN